MEEAAVATFAAVDVRNERPVTFIHRIIVMCVACFVVCLTHEGRLFVILLLVAHCTICTP